MSYKNRRYRVVAGKLEKAWDGRTGDGWCETKEAAWAAVESDKPAHDAAGKFKADDPSTPERDESKALVRPAVIKVGNRKYEVAGVEDTFKTKKAAEAKADEIAASGATRTEGDRASFPGGQEAPSSASRSPPATTKRPDGRPRVERAS